MNQIAVICSTCIVLSNFFVISASAANEEERKVEEARKEFFNCQIGYVRIIDDHDSDIKNIALALTNHCGKEYAAQNKIFASYSLDNSNERRMFTVDQNSDGLKIDASLHIVGLNRQGKLPVKKP